MKKIIRFSGDYRFLSNFFICDIKIGNVIYKSAEHAYQAMKTFNEDERKAIRNASTPSEAKKLGGTVTMRKNWDKIKVGIMRMILKQKFLKDEILRKKLILTRGYILEEGNSWGDIFWGIYPCNSGKGKNMLGKLLMEIRSIAIANNLY